MIRIGRRRYGNARVAAETEAGACRYNSRTLGLKNALHSMYAMEDRGGTRGQAKGGDVLTAPRHRVRSTALSPPLSAGTSAHGYKPAGRAEDASRRGLAEETDGGRGQ
ncbi:hypothetical protein SKAU_G00363530 [Synaphobranchus kaupii]|uniref:Uncharacterized protein n=1 Tax=Synaphobranchus kaupii TaxID=118154 RepID=A0A9Q1EIT3_SYNKA|nr:hypothetical protein SKAU_G00363530 [Synaphobranchus kaupii]